MTLREYIAEIDRQYRTGIAREHSYRPALQQLLAGMLPACVVTNEPAREECGAPDYIIVRQRDNMPVGFIEAKDIGDSDLDGHKQHREQFSRYKAALDHLIFTDYLDFHLYIDGEAAGSVRVGEERDGHIRMVEGCEEAFGLLIRQMAEAAPQRITSSTRLAQQMAMKTRLLAEAIRRAFDESNRERDNSQLQDILDAFRRILIHDLAPEEFADIYAQTIAYGMFAARLHDDTPEDFSRMEAASLIPRTNPFLRNIFQRIAGFDLDPRIAWIVDDLACTFAATDVRRIMKRYERDGRHSDPMIHFYEDFLSAYNPRLRKSRGVWYTPQSVVGFIVRTVDELLRREFSLPLGLADYSCVSREVKNTQYNKNNRKDRPTYKVQFHKVQLLDPAAGTGTFLAEAVQQIHDKFSRQAGLWQSYVEEHLLPRLNGFELLMASYAVAHLKLDMVLGETGYEPHTGKRLRIYLTNSLEECHPDTSTLFDRWLSDEANEANRIKRDTPVMVMMGNPPYNGSSKNKGAWIMKLMDTYKKEPGGRLPLKERNPKWLNDDYVKFIRLAQDYIERTGEGILAFINPHGYLDNPTFRGMRWQLLRTFDRIYAIDLHGNSKKKETCPDGTKDENVFDIMQGVSINFFVKTGEKAADELGCVFHYDLYGKRKQKYAFLDQTSFADIPFAELHPQAPMYFFVPKDYTLEEEYNKGFGINELFGVSSVGVVSTKDSFLICDSKNDVAGRIEDLISLPEAELRSKYGLKDTRDWSIRKAKADVGSVADPVKIVPIDYRWGDTKFLYYTGTTNGIVARPRFHSMRHLLIPSNLALLTCRQLAGKDWSHVSVSRHIVDDCRVSNKTKERGYVFPLYVERESGEAGKIFEKNRLAPNFVPETLQKIEQSLGEEAEPTELFCYIYAVLHSPTYRERYKEFLKTDFPRIPYPTDATLYHNLAEKGCKLCRLHLMESTDTWETGTTYPVGGSNVVEEVRYADGRVYINKEQYFDHIPEEAWNFCVGGYQPAQKWLKDRKGRRLDGFKDNLHYEHIIHALTRTIEIMQEIECESRGLWSSGH